MRVPILRSGKSLTSEREETQQEEGMREAAKVTDENCQLGQGMRAGHDQS